MVRKKQHKNIAELFAPTDKKRVLQVGYGIRHKRPLHQIFSGKEWEVVTLDTIPDTAPDIEGDITAVPAIPDHSVEAVWLADSLKFLYPHQAMAALKECVRILKPNGIAFMTVPDVPRVAETIKEIRLHLPLYHVGKEPVTALDLLYGPTKTIASGAYEAAHKTGYSARLLADTLGDAGFGRITVKRDGFHLWATAYKVPVAEPGRAPFTIDEPDINDIIKKRDALDKPPQIWKGFPPKKEKE